MTLRVKTIEYAFPPNFTSLASATARDFTTITLAIPETTSRTFRSVHLEMSYVDNNTTTPVTTSAVLMGIQLNAIAIDSATVTQNYANSGEGYSVITVRDVTAYFVTNYTGTSMTCLARLTVTGPITLNASAKLVITYEYDDTATTQIKTVKIPVDGNTGNLTTTLTALGGVANQIPLLDEFLPEAAKVIRSYFFQMDTHTGRTAAGTGTLTMRYDGATSVNDTALTQTDANSDVSYRRIDNLLALTTNATHSIEAAATVATSVPCPCLNGVIVVTYEFAVVANTTLNGDIDAATTSVVVTDASTWPATPFTVQVDDEKLRVTARTTNTLTVTRGFDGTTAATHTTGAAVLATIMNSIVETCVDEDGWIGGTTTADKSRFTRNFLAAEPGLISLKQSGIQFFCVDAGAVTLDLRIGSQASRTFAHAATARCGGVSSMRRIDAGAVGGAGMTFTRGRNSIVVDFFTTSATAGNIGTNASGVAYINYTSGQSAPGGGDHHHSTAWVVHPTAVTGLVQKKVMAAANIKTPIIPEADYYLTGVNYHLMYGLFGTPLITYPIAVQGETQAAEGSGAGWEDVYSSFVASDAEVGTYISWGRGRDIFKRWPGDVADGHDWNLETARDYRFDIGASGVAHWTCIMWVTYHSMTFPKTIAVTGSGGGTVTINVRRATYEAGTLVWTGTRVGDGNVTATLMDDIDTKFTEARESDTLVGRSGNWT